MGGWFDENADEEEDPEEEQMKISIEEEKGKYKKQFEKLRAVKKEIENLESLVKQNQEKLNSDFEKWFAITFPQPSQSSPEKKMNAPQMPPPVSVPKLKLAWGDSTKPQPEIQPTQKPTAPTRAPSPRTLPITQTSVTSLRNLPPKAHSTQNTPQTSPHSDGSARTPRGSLITIEAPRLTRTSLVVSDSNEYPMLPKPTGMSSVDEDIKAFYEARAHIIQSSPRNVS